MLESPLHWLTVAFVVVTAGAVHGYFALRWAFMRASEKFAAMVDRSVGGVGTVSARTHAGAGRERNVLLG